MKNDRSNFIVELTFESSFSLKQDLLKMEFNHLVHS